MPETDWNKDTIKALRLKMGLTQEQFAQLVGVTVKTVSTWERGDNTPSPMAQQALDATKGSHNG